MFFKNKAILMIHGFVGGCYDFNNFHNDLQLEKHFDVFTYTLPAHEKLIIKDVKYKEWINESIRQIELLINNGYKEIYLIGHSMGGVIATHLASIYPQVKKLVLVAPAFRYFSFKDGKIDMKSINETIKTIPEIMKSTGTNQTLSNIIKTPITTIIEFTKLISQYQNSVTKITCPTLIIHGNDDVIVPCESTDYVYNSIKSKTNILVNVPKLTHECFTSKNHEKVRQIIKDFLKTKEKKKKEIIDL